jgi:excisionase family DNA binding protein
VTLDRYLAPDHVTEVIHRIDRLLDEAYGSEDLVLLRLSEVADLLGVSVPTVRRRVRSGDLRPTRLFPTDTVRISVKDLRFYLRRQ